jgi:hypothetical protein
MNLMRYMPLVAALSLVAVGSPLGSDEQQPQTTPTRDADITYQITRPGEPVIVERRRWLAKIANSFDASTGPIITRLSSIKTPENSRSSMLQVAPTASWRAYPTSLRKKGRS